jgi:uncharacterized protein YgbK (DUF1537 family)
VLTPVAETEFARDPAFAFEHSHLPSWLNAHSEGRLQTSEVASTSLSDLRTGGPDRVATLLWNAPPGSAVIVNATDDRDLEVFVSGLQRAEAAGHRFLCSGAAPFVRVRSGIEIRTLLTARDLGLEAPGGGLTIVGSYVDKTSEQLDRALQEPGVVAIEISVPRTHAVPALPDGLTEHLPAGRDVILHTPREHILGASDAFAQALVPALTGLSVRPRYVLVKGGSTASTLATNAIGVKRATVLGQLLPGVPVWRLGEEGRWPGLPFVIFAGNVGTSESLAEAIRTLRGEPHD